MNKKPVPPVPQTPNQRAMALNPHAHKLIQPKAVLQRPPAVAPPRAPVRPNAAKPVQLKPAIGTAPGVSVWSVIQEARGPRKGGKKAAKKAQRRAVVTLTVGTQNYSGVSSGQYGHAEMQALRKFIVLQDSVAEAYRALNRATKLKVQCPNQAVCGSCKIILEALGFSAKTGTVFSTAKSGGVSWGANMKVRELMDHAGLTADYQRAVRAGAK